MAEKLVCRATGETSKEVFDVLWEVLEDLCLVDFEECHLCENELGHQSKGVLVLSIEIFHA